MTSDIVISPCTEWRGNLSGVFIPRLCRPTLTQNGTGYALAEDYDRIKSQIRAGLRICAHEKIQYIVVAGFGLGPCDRNPPQMLAEIWREVICDPILSGRIEAVAFVLRDSSWSTSKRIADEIAQKSGYEFRGQSTTTLTDYEILKRVFSVKEVQRLHSKFNISVAPHRVNTHGEAVRSRKT